MNDTSTGLNRERTDKFLPQAVGNKSAVVDLLWDALQLQAIRPREWIMANNDIPSSPVVSLEICHSVVDLRVAQSAE